MEKNKIWYSSRFWVALYALVTAIVLGLQLVVGLGKFEGLNQNADIPLETIAWYWFALVSLFCGFDRAVDIRETLQMSSGQMSMGDLDKLRGIILVSLALFIVSLIGTIFAEGDFQTMQFGSAFAMTIILYTSGNKAVKFSKHYCLVDDDNDGIPDEYQKEYYKWERAQKKDGVDPQYITFDYFMDSRDE